VHVRKDWDKSRAAAAGPAGQPAPKAKAKPAPTAAAGPAAAAAADQLPVVVCGDFNAEGMWSTGLGVLLAKGEVRRGVGRGRNFRDMFALLLLKRVVRGRLEPAREPSKREPFEESRQSESRLKRAVKARESY
jgi:hypothetical protein